MRGQLHPLVLLLAVSLLGPGCTGFVEEGDGGTSGDGEADAVADGGDQAALDEPAADGDPGPGDGDDPEDDPGGTDGPDGADPGSDPGPGCTPDSCSARMWCHDGTCVCQSGWRLEGSDCSPVPASEPASRSAAEVCARWNADYPQRAASVWTPGAEACAPGEVDPQALDDGVRRLNLWRWLVGLEPAYDDRSLNVYAQACAVLIRANGQLSHTPPEAWTCYSPEGATGAGHCNEAMGSYDPASAIDQYIFDWGVPSFGHRRWLLDPPYLPAGLGQADGFNCTYVMTGGNVAFPPFVALPPPGPVPQGALVDTWTVGAAGFEPGVQVSLRDLADGSASTPEARQAEGSYGSYAYLAFQPELPLIAGHDYEVSIGPVRLAGAAQAETLVYVVRPVACP